MAFKIDSGGLTWIFSKMLPCRAQQETKCRVFFEDLKINFQEKDCLLQSK